MKATPQQRQSSPHGFTLIELLIVITIIAILAGLAFPAGSAVINSAKKAKAGAAAQAVASAITEYHLEYGRYPGPPGADFECNSGNAAAKDLLLCLLGDHDASGDFPNPREIPFLEATYTESGAGGFQKDELVNNNNPLLWDPWGAGYYIAIDGDYDNKLTDPETANLIRKNVLVSSPGKDGAAAHNGITINYSAGTPTPSGGGDNDNVNTW